MVANGRHRLTHIGAVWSGHALKVTSTRWVLQRYGADVSSQQAVLYSYNPTTVAPPAGTGMSVNFRSITSTTYASRTNTTLTAPAGIVDGDILIAVIAVGGSSLPSAPTPPTGFTMFGTNTAINDGSFYVNLYIAWKRAASESGSYAWTHGTQSTQGTMKAYSGCLASGTPLGVTSNNTGTGNSSVGTGITTTANNNFLLLESHDWTSVSIILYQRACIRVSWVWCSPPTSGFKPLEQPATGPSPTATPTPLCPCGPSGWWS